MIRIFLSILLALFLPCGLTRAADSKPARPERVNVVLLHGFWNDAAVFKKMQAMLELLGCRCYAPTFWPNDFRYGVHAETTGLAPAIDAHFGRTAPLVFVCFSNGGLVARDYVENMGGMRRTRAMFFISTAHRGTLWAALSPQPGVREFAPGSAFLRSLNAHAGTFQKIPVRAYWTPFDLVIIPATNTRWPFDQTSSHPVLCPFHPMMPQNKKVIADIAARIVALR